MLLAGRLPHCHRPLTPTSRSRNSRNFRCHSLGSRKILLSGNDISLHIFPDLSRGHRCSCLVRRLPSVTCPSSGRPDMGTTTDASDVAIVLVDHGSKRAEANAMLEEFADLYRGHSGRQKVDIAHMELAEPSIGEAVAKCASEGYTKVVIAPYFLSRGRHITTDIPAMVAKAQKAHPEVACVIAEPIGLDPLMAELIEKRVAGALQIS